MFKSVKGSIGFSADGASGGDDGGDLHLFVAHTLSLRANFTMCVFFFDVIVLFV